MSKITGCLILAFFFCAQSLADDYQQWQQQQNAEFTQMQQAVDQQFNDHLKSSWQAANIQANPYEVENKPSQLPRIEIDTDGRIVPVAAPEVLIDSIVDVPSENFSGKRRAFSFYGLRLQVRDQEDWGIKLRRKLNEKNVYKTWQKLEQRNSSSLISQFKRIKLDYHLNDWDFALMLYEYAKLHNNQLNEQLITTWFWLTQAGYKAKVGFDKYQVYLMFATQQALFDIQFYQGQQERYYFANITNSQTFPDRILTYKRQHPGSNKRFDLLLDPDLNLGVVAI